MKETSQSAKNALLKLAFFEPNLVDEKNYQIIDYLILDCISGYGSLLECDSQEIAKYIKSTYLIDFDEAEIIKGAERLEQKGCIRTIRQEESFESPKYKFIKSDDNEQLKRYKEIQDSEDLVMSEWSDNLKAKYGKILNKNKLDRITESFKTFLTKMFVRHGKESVSILYPESEKSQEWISSIQEEIIKDLPRLDKELDIILQIEIPIFFKSNLLYRKKYLNNLFNASFLWHLIQVDENCTEYFKETTKDQILVLDANILFSLIGLHGGQVLVSIHQLLDYANHLEYKLVITTKTLDEFYESIKRSCEKALEITTYTKSVAKAAINTLDSSNFLVAYWKEFLRKGLSIEEFAIEKSHINSILQGLKISITNDFREEIEESQELLDEESTLRSTCGNIAPTIIEHDAFHCIFIKKIRQKSKYKYSEAVAWFLTHDSKLPVYAHVGLKGSRALPFCILTNEWIQINRPFLKRTQNEDEFEQSFQILVTQPYLRSILNNFKIDKIKERLLLRLNRYNNMSTQLAFEMATDVHFLSALSKETSDKIFDEKIDSTIVEINRDLKQENKELYIVLDQQSEENAEKIDTLRNTINEIKDELVSKNSSFETFINRVTDLKKEIETWEIKYSENKSKYSDLNKKYELYKSGTKWFVFTILVISLLLIIWVIDDSFNWLWYQNLTNKIVIKIILSIIVVLSFMNIPIYKHWKIWLPLIGCFVIALLMIICI